MLNASMVLNVVRGTPVFTKLIRQADVTFLLVQILGGMIRYATKQEVVASHGLLPQLKCTL
jgi:hypothetical protein